MKKFFTIAYHKEKIKDLFAPEYSITYANQRSPQEIFGFGLSLFVYTYIMYAIMYVFIFFLGYPYFSRLNDAMKADFEAKGNSAFSLFLNTYPWNVLYILATLVILLLLTSALSFGVAKLLEDGKRSYKAHLGLCLHGTSILLASLFVIFIANTIFPFNSQVGVVMFSFLVAIWILMFLGGTFFSNRVFVRASNEYFGQPKKRSAITWLLPLLFVIYTIFGIVTGI
jgi:hypothetical protein